MKVYAATIPPFTVAPTALQENARTLVNKFILGRMDGQADGVINFSDAVGAGIEDGSSAAYDTVMSDYLTSDGTALSPNEAYYEALAWQYVTDAEDTDWKLDDQSGGTEDGSRSIAVWDFDDNTGSTARDTGDGTGSTKTKHPTTLTNVAWGKSRRVGASAGTFNGTSSYGTTDLKPNTTASLTVSAWVKLTDGSTDRPVFARGSVAGAPSLTLTYQASDKHWAAQVQTAATGEGIGSTTALSDNEAQIGVWTHLAVSYDAEDQELSLFVNGHQDTNPPSVRPFNDPNGATWIGRTKDSYFAGDIAAVRVWARKLGEAEMELWAAPINVLDWELNWTGPPAQAEDNSPYDHPGTLTGDASYSCNGHTEEDECATHFGGVDGAITRNAVLNTDQSFSISAWARLENTDEDYTVVSQDGNHVAGFLLQWNSHNNSWRFLTAGADTDNPATAEVNAQAGASDPHQWTHLVGVYDATAGTLSLYVNGEPADTQPARHSWNATGQFAVGRGFWNGQKTGHLTGDIDAIRAYQGVLTADQVVELKGL
ncbi:hypothetical protein BJY16_007064 [Actinoplanes octamycinicus]|uniref:LamG-like jellyroll fold domain-containing protein n=2 Tax=Actinoplanes octamycinicus TaxID=135948 RepID=A0A7W7H420_9ACTN|nr:LamG-like jellyroll fold domain-containing protein [Actinoplanes octamycinicus]MBB4743605.1 hypothetical protein [Actinoplanes octamycinicus]GIE61030.1 hypothetical protein Aoc01nite_64320 [Actinoplanes octamycinicus]